MNQNPFIKRIADLIHQKSGPLTQELALENSSLGLGKLPEHLLPDRITNMVCGYCSTGCSLAVHIKDNEPVNLTPTMNYPVNLGEACPKGWEALTPLKALDRATTPYLRKDRSGKLEPVGWDEALIAFVENFRKIQDKYGKESVAFLSTGQICTEEMAFLGALCKFGMGMIHGDGNTRQCMATAATAYKESFGFDAPPFTYKDFEESDVIVLVGSNLCIAHPILWQRICQNPGKPEIIVVDPRKTETAMAATKHYALAPKSDLTLLYGLANILIQENWIDKSYIEKHTQGFAEFKAHTQQFSLEQVCQTTGLSKEQLYEFAFTIFSHKRVSFWWTMGVNQSHEGVRTAQALINLALMTGNMGRPGTGANSITGQCNAMGSRLFSNTTNLLGGHDFLNPFHRRKIADILGIEPWRISDQNSLAYDQIIEMISMNKIKGLWVIATNPSHSWIHQKEFKDILGQLDFLVVQDMYHTTETAQMADLILPAAGWGEKEGMVINSERRIGLFRKVTQPPGEALADFDIFKLVARYWGCEKIFEEWKSPEIVFQILKKISKGQPCDISGIRDYKMIEDSGGIQWPFTLDSLAAFGVIARSEATKQSQHEMGLLRPAFGGTRNDDKELVPIERKNPFNVERRLFEDGKYYFPDEKARFIFEEVRSSPELPDDEYPFMLLTGRGSSSQWHTQTRTGKSSILRAMYPEHVYVEINPEDARRFNIQHNEWVSVATKRAVIKARASITPTVKRGQIFMPMHYEETNCLTFPAFDPYSRQPSYKMCAARISHQPY